MATFTVAPGVSSAPINLAGVLGTNPEGSAMNMLYAGATITVSTSGAVSWAGAGNASMSPATILANKPGTSGHLSSTVPTSLQCDPAAAAGTAVRCTVTLDGNAPPEGLALEISSSNASVSLPAVLKVRGGHESAEFEGFIERTAAAAPVVISVQTAANAVSARFQVNAQSPVLTIPSRIRARFDTPVRFAAAGSDPLNLPVSLSAAGLPAGATFDPASGVFQWTPASSQQGNYSIRFTAANSAGTSTSQSVELEISDGRPVVTALANAASRSQDSVCRPGSIASLEGAFLISNPEAPATARVMVNDAPATVISESAERVDFLCPAGTPGTQLSVKVENERGTSVPVTATLQSESPGIFSVNDTGQGQATAIRSYGSDMAAIPNPAHSYASPAQPGDMLSLYVTGVDAARAASWSVHLGDVLTAMVSVSPVAGHAGVFAIQFQVPAGMPQSDRTKIFLESTQADGKSVSSNTVTIAVNPVPR
jgi:uncharacterized protein (TIGR03437 family)